MIPDATLNQIQERLDIVEVVSGYLPLRRAGRSFKACCPFHGEKTPSFHVNPDKQIFHCFGCGAGGNIFGFVMKMEKKDFREAVEMLAERAGIEIPDDRPSRDTEAAKRAELLAKANHAAADFYHRVLTAGREAEKAREYLRRRGILDKTIEDFRVGFAPEAWDSLLQGLKAKIGEAALEKAGLLLTRKDGGYYDRFRNRVIFPILDAKGVCVAFGGRVMDDSVPKYLNSPETDLYVKGRHLYGLYQARKAIRESDLAIVVEGYMDLIACHQAGVENVVASLGTALTADQVRLIKRNTRNVIMLYDADKAGEAATLRGLELFLEEGMEVRVVRLSPGHDPDSFIKDRGAARFREELAAAKTLFEYKLALLKERHPAGTVEGKVKIANEMVALFAKVPNEILRSAWTKELAKELSLSEEALFAEMRKGADRGARPAAPKEAPAPKDVPPVEKMLLALLLDSPDFADGARQELSPEDFRHPAARRLAKGLLESREFTPAAALINVYKDDAEAVEVITLALAEADKIEGPADKRRSFADCLLRVKRSRLGVEREGLRSRILEAEREGDKNRIRQLMGDLEELNKRDKQINEKK
ncbi:MAG TPA: DNA primase [Candidatus Eisenbacteria bacterium]|nr:DNA primase [Candidatus Eisenbacteria bacterium]